MIDILFSLLMIGINILVWFFVMFIISVFWKAIEDKIECEGIKEWSELTKVEEQEGVEEFTRDENGKIIAFPSKVFAVNPDMVKTFAPHPHIEDGEGDCICGRTAKNQKNFGKNVLHPRKRERNGVKDE